MTLTATTIRPSQATDHEAIANLAYAHLSPEKKQAYLKLNAAAAERFRRQILSHEGVCLVAIQDDTCLGYLVGGLKATPLTTIVYVELETIIVAADHRNHGLGTMLARRFLTWAKETGADRVSVTASPRNEAAIRFYQRLGFTPASLELEQTL